MSEKNLSEIERDIDAAIKRGDVTASEMELSEEEQLLDTSDLVDLNLPYEFKEPGEILEGIFLGIQGEFIGMDGNKVPRFAMYSQDNGIVSFNGGVTLSSLRFVPAGTVVRLTYGGEKPLKVGKIKLFRIQCPRGFIGDIARQIVKDGGLKAIESAHEDFDPFSDELPPVPNS